LPSGIDPGSFLLNAVANGIASPTILNIQMSSAHDTISVRNDPSDSGRIQILGTDGLLLGEFRLSDFNRILVTGDANADTLTVDYQFGNPLPAGGLDYTGTGVTVLNVNDQTTTSSQTFTVDATSVQRSGSAAITWSGSATEFVNINGGSGGNIYNISSISASLSLTLHAGSGNDTVNVLSCSGSLTVDTGSYDIVNITSSSNTLDGIGSVTVNDPTGTSTVTLDDSGYQGNEAYTITDTTVTIGRSAAFSLTYNGIAALNLNAGSGSDSFAIDSTSASTTVNAGTGGNVYAISPVTQWLAASIAAPLTLNGGGADVLVFDDTADPSSDVYSFDAVPMSLTLGSTGTTIADFFGMGTVSVEANGMSTLNDLSGTVLMILPGRPPCSGGNPTQPVRDSTMSFAGDQRTYAPMKAMLVSDAMMLDLVSRAWKLAHHEGQALAGDLASIDAVLALVAHTTRVEL
jgi:hypothetical protein